MPLRLTFKPDERFIVNGCAIRNASRRQTLTIENRADVVRGHDLLKESQAVTPVTRAYFMIQTVLVAAELRDEFDPQIQKKLAELFTVFGADHADSIVKAANFVSLGDHYKALRSLSKLIKYESQLLALISRNSEAEVDESTDTTQEEAL